MMADFKKSFTLPLLRTLEKERRKPVQSKIGQLLIFDEKLAAFDAILKGRGITLSGEAFKAAFEAGKLVANDYQAKMMSTQPRRYKMFLDKLNSGEIYLSPSVTLGVNAWIVPSFGTAMDAVKKAILANLLPEGSNDTLRSQVSEAVHKGHGQAGLAVSEVEIAATLAKAKGILGSDIFTDELFKWLNTNFSLGTLPPDTGTRLKELTNRYSSVVTQKGGLRADYLSIITFQIGTENREEGVVEKQIKGLVRNFIKSMSPSLMHVSGSSTLAQKMKTVILDAVFEPSKKRKNVTQKRGVPKAKLDTKGAITVFAAKKPVSAVKITKQSGPLPKQKKAAETSAFDLRAYINSLLFARVSSKMIAPSLQFRTGTFAASATVTNVTQTPQGFPSIEYTYLKSPYQIFETKAPWATPLRDPKVIIGSSIREIAAAKVQGRFYLRRV